MTRIVPDAPAFTFSKTVPMRNALGLLLPILLLGFVAQPAQGQILPFSVGIEARLGAGFPTGDFGGGGAFVADPGLAFAIGLRVDPTALLGVYAGYQRTNFGCPHCADFGLDDSAVAEGLEAVVYVHPPFGLATASPWLRGGILHQTLGFSGYGDTMTSSAATGFTVGAGVAIPVAFVEIAPGLHFQSVPASFEFGDHGARNVDATRFGADVGLIFRF
jgi:hypothetical protein